jgi:hypothetical protein
MRKTGPLNCFWLPPFDKRKAELNRTKEKHRDHLARLKLVVRPKGASMWPLLTPLPLLFAEGRIISLSV